MSEQTSAQSDQPMPQPAPDAALTFKALVQGELKVLLGPAEPDSDPRVSIADGDSRFGSEPKVSRIEPDLFGLALSGGGIRSATFNLGLLTALARSDLLRHVHYLSTVSGGGYMGAWWTAWLKRNKPEGGDTQTWFPVLETSDPASNIPEPKVIRHLREFSRFLVPRSAIFEAESASAIGHLLAIIPPALAACSALAIGGIITLLWSTYLISKAPPVASLFVILVSPLLLYWMYSDAATGRALTAPGERSRWWLAGCGAAALLLIAAFWLGWAIKLGPLRQAEPSQAPASAPIPTGSFLGTQEEWVNLLESLGSPFAPKRYAEAAEITWTDVASGAALRRDPGYADRSAALVKSGGRERDRTFVPTYPLVPEWARGLYVPSAIWFATVIIMSLLRAVLWRIVGAFGWFYQSEASTKRHRVRRMMLAVSNRILGRLALTAGLWFVFAVIWQLGTLVVLRDQEWNVAYVSALATGLFHVTRTFLSRSGGTGRRSGIRSAVARLVPRVLANIALLSLLVLVSAAILVSIPGSVSIFPATPPMVGIAFLFTASVFVGVLTLLLFDPSMLSLHSFYRSRLARAYLGASHKDPDDRADKKVREEMRRNRYTEERPGDDLRLEELVGLKPIHLVCCAANDLAGDRLSTLNRGARSAVLSQSGLTVGGLTYTQRHTGTLWLSQAIAASGAAVSSNMGGLSKAVGGASSVLLCAFNIRLGFWVRLTSEWSIRRILPGRRFYGEMLGRTRAPGETMCQEVHLSDGGHFENLGLYELVRRQCRNIIVSDCGADPEYKFEDVGHAIQLVREDFNVEIDIDLSPLRPAPNGFARQHVAVGRIRYPDSQQGTLLLFKPTLTGDEPEDVQQYRLQNPAFPQQSTGDQFFDEAQWEAHRRLGEHCGTSVLGVLTERAVGVGLLLSRAFSQVAAFWEPAPPQVLAATLDVSARFTSLLGRISADTQSQLLSEVFPEASAGRLQSADETETAFAAKESSRLCLLVEIMQFMEDTWFQLLLDTHAGHSSNAGWVDILGRFATMPSFRKWWPLLRGNFSPKFGDFLGVHFPELGEETRTHVWSVLEATNDTPSLLRAPQATLGKSQDRWCDMYKPFGSDREFAVADLILERPSDSPDTRVIRFSDIRVHPSLRASGAAARFVKFLAVHLRAEQKVKKVYVVFSEEARGEPSATDALFVAAAPFIQRGFGSFHLDRTTDVSSGERTGRFFIDTEALDKLLEVQRLGRRSGSRASKSHAGSASARIPLE